MPIMSEPQRQATQPSGWAPLLICVAAGLGANLVVYLVAWWVSKRTPSDWGGYAGFAPLAAFGQVLCGGTVLIVIATLVATTLLNRAGHRSLAKSLAIGALLPIVLVPAAVAIIANAL
jgi:hypothetical protein